MNHRLIVTLFLIVIGIALSHQVPYDACMHLTGSGSFYTTVSLSLSPSFQPIIDTLMYQGNSSSFPYPQSHITGTFMMKDMVLTFNINYNPSSGGIPNQTRFVLMKVKYGVAPSGRDWFEPVGGAAVSYLVPNATLIANAPEQLKAVAVECTSAMKTRSSSGGAVKVSAQ